MSEIQVFWGVTLCHCVSCSWHFKGSWCLHLHRQVVQEDHLSMEIQAPLNQRHSVKSQTWALATWDSDHAVHPGKMLLLVAVVHINAYRHSHCLYYASITNRLPTKSVIPGEGCYLQSMAETCGIHAWWHLKPWVKQHNTLDSPILGTDIAHVGVLYKQPALLPFATQVTAQITTPVGRNINRVLYHFTD